MITSTDLPLNGPQESTSIVVHLHEPFLKFDPNSDLSFEDKSAIYCSLVALVKEGYPFDNALQDKAARFLKSLGPKWGNDDYTEKLVTDLHYRFVVISPLDCDFSSTVVRETTMRASAEIRCPLVESDLVSKVFATVQPHTLPISENERIIDNLIWIIFYCINLATQPSARNLGFTAAVEKSNHREMIFQKAVFPSSQFVTFLISNRYILNGELLYSFMSLLSTFLRICPFHRPILHFVLASPIVMGLSDSLSFVENSRLLYDVTKAFRLFPREWKMEAPEAVQSAKRMMQSLISEGFEDTLEQMLKHDKHGDYGPVIVNNCRSISYLLGSNVKRPQ
ncbi:hypothetical protein BLNAU_3458 [Blattamonas nauphoetae]|uniref:Uncharacterized protein n=1 Tax=Blattamonas nauphoetae TaxID=2049346 RepID=A0ABQ9YD14_9EUKA|nr:hypothetical protein BLNAU_3458 [Blattamonas nauphoetae]